MSKAARGARFPLALDAVHARPAEAAPAKAVLRPQRPLAEAAAAQSRQAVPSGIGLDSASVRERMVQRLRRGGIACDAVLHAFAAVERHAFVDSALANQAYEDTSLPIGLGQTISKPSVVARMLELLFDGEGARRAGTLGRVLEVGTGCGYQTALLSRVSRAVVSVERLRPLHDKARQHLSGWRSGDVRLVYGDGRLGHAPWAPYDSIVAAAGGDALPPAWLEQLAPGGRLVAPMHDSGAGGQVLCVVDRLADGGYAERRVGTVHFVPLKSGRE